MTFNKFSKTLMKRGLDTWVKLIQSQVSIFPHPHLRQWGKLFNDIDPFPWRCINPHIGAYSHAPILLGLDFCCIHLWSIFLNSIILAWISWPLTQYESFASSFFCSLFFISTLMLVKHTYTLFGNIIQIDPHRDISAPVTNKVFMFL